MAVPTLPVAIKMRWSRRNLLSALLTLILFALFLDNIDLPSPDVRRITRRVDVDDAKIADLRIAALGTSFTWGSTLPDRLTQAYPYLLSPDANNAALRATGPNYPAICTPSLLGVDDMYDVIILQYFQRADEGLVPLARRVRKRFPDTILIVTRTWHPGQIKNVKAGGNLRDWAASRKLEIHSDEFLTAFLETDDDEWKVDTFEPEKKLQDAIVEEIGGHLYVMPFPEENLKEAIKKYRKWFADDFHHFSPEGHEEVARGIKEILKGAMEEYDPETAQLGTWGDDNNGGLELCNSWFESGEVTVPHSPNAKLELFDTRGKYALTIPYEGASIAITNPDEEPRPLHLSFMANAPPPSMYPIATVYINGKKCEHTLKQPPYMVFDEPVHIPVTLEVGSLEPGDNEVKIVPLKDEVAEKPFRLTGAVIGPRYLYSLGRDDEAVEV